MPSIDQIVAQIRTALYGRDVRENIALGIESMSESVSGTNEAITQEISDRTSVTDQLNHLISAEQEARIQNDQTESTLRTQSDTNLQLQITREIADRISGDSLLSNRIDEIVAPTGEAPSAAEVLDARVDVNGTAHNSLGGAIRSQIQDVQTSIEGEELLIHMMQFEGMDIGDGYLHYGESIILKGDKVGIIDFGRNPSATELLAYFDSVGISKFDYAIISHYHTDHVTTDFASMLDTLISNGIDFSNCTFYLPHYGADWTQATNLEWVATSEAAVVSKLTQEGISYVYPEDNDVVMISDHQSLKFNNIGSKYYAKYYDYMLDSGNNVSTLTTYNNFSMIVMLTHYNHKVLFTGDIHSPAMKENVENIEKCDIYKVEHHSLNNTADDQWLSVAKPDYAMISVYSSRYEDESIISRHSVNVISKEGGDVSTTNNGPIEYKLNRNGVIKVVGDSFNFTPVYNNRDLVAGVELIKENFDSSYKNLEGKIDIDYLTKPGIYFCSNATKASSNLVDKTPPGYPSMLTIGAPRIQVIRATYNQNECIQIIDFPYNDIYRFMRGTSSGVFRDWHVYVPNTVFEMQETIQGLINAAMTVPLYRPFMCGISSALGNAMFGISSAGMIVGRRLASRIDFSAYIGGLRSYVGQISTSTGDVAANKLENEIVYEDYEIAGINFPSGGTVGECLYSGNIELQNQSYNYISASLVTVGGSNKVLVEPILTVLSGTKNLAVRIFRMTTESTSNATYRFRVAAKVPITYL